MNSFFREGIPETVYQTNVTREGVQDSSSHQTFTLELDEKTYRALMAGLPRKEFLKTEDPQIHTQELRCMVHGTLRLVDGSPVRIYEPEKGRLCYFNFSDTGLQYKMVQPCGEFRWGALLFMFHRKYLPVSKRHGDSPFLFVAVINFPQPDVPPLVVTTADAFFIASKMPKGVRPPPSRIRGPSAKLPAPAPPGIADVILDRYFEAVNSGGAVDVAEALAAVGAVARGHPLANMTGRTAQARRLMTPMLPTNAAADDEEEYSRDGEGGGAAARLAGSKRAAAVEAAVLAATGGRASVKRSRREGGPVPAAAAAPSASRGGARRDYGDEEDEDEEGLDYGGRGGARGRGSFSSVGRGRGGGGAGRRDALDDLAAAADGAADGAVIPALVPEDEEEGDSSLDATASMGSDAEASMAIAAMAQHGSAGDRGEGGDASAGVSGGSGAATGGAHPGPAPGPPGPLAAPHLQAGMHHYFMTGYLSGSSSIASTQGYTQPPPPPLQMPLGSAPAPGNADAGFAVSSPHPLLSGGHVMPGGGHMMSGGGHMMPGGGHMMPGGHPILQPNMLSGILAMLPPPPHTVGLSGATSSLTGGLAAGLAAHQRQGSVTLATLGTGNNGPPLMMQQQPLPPQPPGHVPLARSDSGGEVIIHHHHHHPLRGQPMPPALAIPAKSSADDAEAAAAMTAMASGGMAIGGLDVSGLHSRLPTPTYATLSSLKAQAQALVPGIAVDGAAAGANPADDHLASNSGVPAPSPAAPGGGYLSGHAVTKY